MILLINLVNWHVQEINAKSIKIIYMKILPSSFQKFIETDRISFSVLREGKIEVESLKFKIEIQSNEPIQTVWIGTEESRIELVEWFKRMLSQKLILTENSEAEKYFEQTLFVNDVSLPYITKTIFQILQRLLPNHLSLISLSYQ